MKNLLRFLSYVLVATVASCVTMFVCVQKQNAGMSKLDQLQAIITQRYIEGADETQLQDAAAAAMVAATGDRWSYYISAAELQSYENDKANSYVGIGITITVREDNLGFDIVQVAKGGPAEEAGILPGDILTGAQGQNVAELGTDGASVLILGDPGTYVDVTVLRDGESLDFHVERRLIQVEVVSYALLEGNVGYIKIANFNSRCAQESIAAVQELTKQGAQALVFDVRYNGGGYKSEMVDLLDHLLPEGPLFRSEEYTGVTHVDESDASCIDLPMAVLVNGGSYSAAEFFAAALSEYDAAVVVGLQTSGKGHYQVTYELNDGSAVNLSIGRYTTPNGVSLDGVGITPDVIVEVDEETDMKIYYGTLEPMEDPQILAALDAVKP